MDELHYRASSPCWRIDRSGDVGREILSCLEGVFAGPRIMALDASAEMTMNAPPRAARKAAHGMAILVIGVMVWGLVPTKTRGRPLTKTMTMKFGGPGPWPASQGHAGRRAWQS